MPIYEFLQKNAKKNIFCDFHRIDKDIIISKIIGITLLLIINTLRDA